MIITIDYLEFERLISSDPKGVVSEVVSLAKFRTMAQNSVMGSVGHQTHAIEKLTTGR